MWEKGLLFEKKKKKSYKKGDFAKLAHGVEHPGDPDPTGSRKKAKAGQEQDVLKAKKSGKPLTNWIEGRTKKQKAGDDELESHVRDFAKKHGVGYTEKSMEPKGASSKKARKRERVRQNYDFNNPTKKGTQAYPEDFGGKSNKLSRQVEKDNKTRVRHGEKAYFKNKEKGGESTAVIGSGLKALDEKRKYPKNDAEADLRRANRDKRVEARAERLKRLPKNLKRIYRYDHHALNTAEGNRQRTNQQRDSKAGKEEARMGRKKTGIVFRGGSSIGFRKATVKYNKEKRDFNQSMGTKEEGFKKLRKEGLHEKRRHPRNEAERVLRQQDRHQRGVRRAEQLRGLEAAGGTNAPKGHTRKAGNALQRLNQKQDSKAGKENTRVRHVKNHIMMGIRDKDGQLTPKASKTYTAHRKANLQRKREKRQFNQSMGTE